MNPQVVQRNDLFFDLDTGCRHATAFNAIARLAMLGWFAFAVVAFAPRVAEDVIRGESLLTVFWGNFLVAAFAVLFLCCGSMFLIWLIVRE